MRVGAAAIQPQFLLSAKGVSARCGVAGPGKVTRPRLSVLESPVPITMWPSGTVVGGEVLLRAGSWTRKTSVTPFPGSKRYPTVSWLTSADRITGGGPAPSGAMATPGIGQFAAK